MKRFTVPLIGMHVDIYVGVERDAWRAAIEAAGCKEISPDQTDGETYDSMVWVQELRRPLVLHELSHVVDNLMEYVGSDDIEFRAYIWGWLGEEVLKWMEGVWAPLSSSWGAAIPAVTT